MVYDCSSEGVRRQPFEVWMLDCVGAMGVKRLKAEHRRHIPGVIGYCRGKFEQQVPFDIGFRPDDTALYCLELTEKAFRSQGLALSEPVRIGDWERLTSYPLTVFGLLYGSGLVLDQPYTLEQPVFLPGNEHHGVWGSALLETVFDKEPTGRPQSCTRKDRRPWRAWRYRDRSLRRCRVAPFLHGATPTMARCARSTAASSSPPGGLCGPPVTDSLNEEPNAYR